jgi:hypothetical protein
VTPPLALVRALEQHRIRIAPLDRGSEGELAWCSIEDFKGLESPVVLVTGLSDLASTEGLRRVYVACSRARSLLGMVLDMDLEPMLKLRAAEYARLRAETSR